MGFKSEISDRIIHIPVCPDLYAQVRSKPVKGFDKVSLTTPFDADQSDRYYIQPEGVLRDLYNFPFLLDEYGRPWNEANSYLYNLMSHSHPVTRPADDARRKAAHLLDYKLFLEREGINWLDFTGRRLPSRPTYRYFAHLTRDRSLSPAVVNQHTGDVYRFYQFVAKHWHDIDMERVDSVERIQIYYASARSSGSKSVLKRSQTKRTGGVGAVEMGYVRDDGEDLRPLSIEQARELYDVINQNSWQPIERLIILTALLTGARKQTVLTLRVKHIMAMVKSGANSSNLHKLVAGPGTGLDTKNRKKMTLHLPAQLVEELHVYINCEQAANRRDKLRERYKADYPRLRPISDEDMYVFISDQGNPYYMGADDPRFPMVRYRQTGQVSETLKRKILKSTSPDFPTDFTFHWLRATYAFLLYLNLKRGIDSGQLTHSEVIAFVQKRLHHNNPETTENYLKLFNNINFKMEAQELFEEHLLGSITMEGASNGEG